MEPHVKERIVGAAVLVALGVWLIPWVLDGPETLVEEIEPDAGITLPSTDDIATIRTETVELVPTEAPVEVEAPVPAPEPAVAIAVREPAAQSVPEASDNQAAVASVSEPDPAPPAVAAEQPVNPGGWFVQLGAFSDAANAEQVARRVSTYGFDAFVSDFRSGNGILHRVRVGGFASENEADAAASSLSAHDFAVRVIPPE